MLSSLLFRGASALLPRCSAPSLSSPPPLLTSSRGYQAPTHKDWFHEHVMMKLDMRGNAPNPRVPKKNPLGERVPFARGIILKTLVKKPKKPNSANRKCVLVRLAKSGRELTAHIPGEGHTLQEHQSVLLFVRNSKDLPMVKTKCVRGKYDLGHVIKNTQ